MQKTMKKPIVFLSLMMLLNITSISPTKAMFPNATGLTSEAKATATQFQFLRCSSSIAEFQKLYTTVFKPLVSNATIVHDGGSNASIQYTIDDIEKILGPPDAILSNTKLIGYIF
jgi:hypothetical protein